MYKLNLIKSKSNSNTLNQFDLSGEKLYIGIDVHLKQWSITVRHNKRVLCSKSIDPKPKALKSFLEHNYPQAEYYSAYEAGYFGYKPHKDLVSLGIKNIIVNAADIPSTSKERINKTDRTDSGKIALHLENGSLKGIFIPDDKHLGLRNLSRLRQQMVKDRAREKNRIKSLLIFMGIDKISTDRDWSNNYMKELETIEFTDDYTRDVLQTHLSIIKELTDHIKQIEEKIKTILTMEEHKKPIERIKSLPGIGPITAAVLYLEIMDIKRFPRRDALAEYAGFTPMVQQSGDSESITGITVRQNKSIRSLMVEAAWIASRKGKYLKKFTELSKRMKKNKAIIRLAKMLLFDARREWVIALAE